MVDYNFFDNYSATKAKKSVGVQISLLFSLVMLLVLIGTIGFNYFFMNVRSNQIKHLEEDIAEIQKTDELIRLLDKEALLIELKTTVNGMTLVGENMNQFNRVNENVIAVIVDAMPSDVQLNGLDIIENEIIIEGEAVIKPAIAEFEYNIHRVEYFDSIAIQSITRSEENTFTFSMTLDMGGAVDEN